MVTQSYAEFSMLRNLVNPFSTNRFQHFFKKGYAVTNNKSN